MQRISQFCKTWYFPAFLLAMTPWSSAALALLLGLALSLGAQIRQPASYKSLGKWLLQGSIVALGFGMAPSAVWQAGTKGVGVTAAGLALTFLAGFLITRHLRLTGPVPLLITVGTAICGGSAIAAAGPVIGAKNEEMSVALAAVFLLNGLALIAFPWLGEAIHLSPQAFGYLAAVAIHDTSSVVGAATRFAEASVPIAVTIKLTRALWIIPVTLLIPFFARFFERFAGRHGPTDGATPASRPAKRPVPPWFIVGFIVAVGIRALLPSFADSMAFIAKAGTIGLKGAIFIVSAQMSREALRRVGWRPMVLAIALWGVITVAALASLLAGLA